MKTNLEPILNKASVIKNKKFIFKSIINLNFSYFFQENILVLAKKNEELAFGKILDLNELKQKEEKVSKHKVLFCCINKINYV